MTTRLLWMAALLALVMGCVVGCRDVNQVVTGRQLTCDQTPEDVCIRVADLVATLLRDMRAPTINTMSVKPRTCDGDEVGDTRCWWIDGTFQDGSEEGATSVQVHEHADGALGIHYTSNGSPPDT